MRRLRTLARISMLLLAVLPLLVLVLESLSWLHAVGQFIRSVYGLQCHQSEVRSWSVHGVALPVCSRCLGIYGGLGVAAALGRPRLRHEAYKAWMLISACLIGCDVLTEWVGLRPAHGGLRFATGVVFSYGVALAVLEVLSPPDKAPSTD